MDSKTAVTDGMDSETAVTDGMDSKTAKTAVADGMDSKTAVADGMIRQLAYRVFTQVAQDDLGTPVWRAAVQYTEALRAFREAQRSKKDTSKRALSLQKAQRGFFNAYREDNRFVRSRYNLGVIYLSQGQPQPAYEVFRAVINDSAATAIPAPPCALPSTVPDAILPVPTTRRPRLRKDLELSTKSRFSFIARRPRLRKNLKLSTKKRFSIIARWRPRLILGMLRPGIFGGSYAALTPPQVKIGPTSSGVPSPSVG